MSVVYLQAGSPSVSQAPVGWMTNLTIGGSRHNCKHTVTHTYQTDFGLIVVSGAVYSPVDQTQLCLQIGSFQEVQLLHLFTGLL
jgi:hypothetical protein